MWHEEQAALRASSVLVVFWSKNYIKKVGTLREIKFAAELLRENKLGEPLIVRLDDTPLNASAVINGESSGPPILLPLIERWRALPINSAQALILAQVRRLLIDNGNLSAPDFDRGLILRALDQRAQRESLREVTPVIWLSGHEGFGRRWIAERFMRIFDPNRSKIEVGMTDSDGPLSVLLRIISKGRGATSEELKATLQASTAAGGENEIVQIVNTIDELSLNGKYLLLTLEPLNQDASKWVPDWLIEVIKRLKSSRLPKLFVVAQFSFSAKLAFRREFASQLAMASVSSLETSEAKRYAIKLTGRFDENANRWTDELIDRLVDDAEGNISLLISSARIRSLSTDLQTFEHTDEENLASFSEKLRKYLDACMPQVRKMPDAVSVLRVLIDLQLVTFDDLQLLFPQSNLTAVLGALIGIGLVESPADGVYRVPRMVVRRLDSRLDARQAINSDHLSLVDRYKQFFGKLPQPSNEPLIDKIEARVRAFLLSGNASPTSEIEPFLLTGHLVQSGIRAYDRQDYATSLRLLRTCAEKEKDFSEFNTRCVLFRYFGLAASREYAQGVHEAKSDIDTAVRLLRAEQRKIVGRVRINPSADADFILGFSARLQENWETAFFHYKSAVLKIGDDSGVRVSDCHRELAEVLLHIGPINYRDAIFHAESAIGSRDTILSLDILVKVLIEAFWNDNYLSDNERDKLERKLNAALAKLKTLSTSLGAALWHQRRAEDLMQSGDVESMEEALGLAKAAVQISPRPEYHVLKWRILLRIGTDEYLSQLIDITTEALEDSRQNNRTRVMALRCQISAYLKSRNFIEAEKIFSRNRAKLSNTVVSQIAQAIRDSEPLDLSGWS